MRDGRRDVGVNGCRNEMLISAVRAVAVKGSGTERGVIRRLVQAYDIATIAVARV